MNQPSSESPARCAWARRPEEVEYHDSEWGVPQFDDNRLFEFVVLEAAQAGLSWLTILRRREGYRRAFAGFDPLKVAAFSAADVERLLQDASIIRNRLKIESAIKNAGLFLKLREEHGSFSNYLWSFVNGRVIDGQRRRSEDIPVVSPESDKLAKDLKKKGFSFLGSTTMYAYMQATGLVNDHLTGCFRYEETREIAKKLGLA